MKTLVDFALKNKYNKVKNMRPHLEAMKILLDWEAFLKLFPDKETTRGRPAYDKILMLKILFLQSWYGISDEEVEFQINDRLSFQQFLNFPQNIPDYSTVWRFRESLTEANIAEDIWAELQRQIGQHEVKVQKGVTAKTFEGHVDLAEDDEVVYRDRGYSGCKTKAKGDATMKKGKLTPKQKLRNKRIARKRCQGEHPFATMHRSSHAGRTKLTTLARVYVQQLFVCFAYNLARLRFLINS